MASLTPKILEFRQKVLREGKPKFSVVVDCHDVDVLPTWKMAKTAAWAWAWSHPGRDVSAVESRVFGTYALDVRSTCYRVDYVAYLDRFEGRDH